MIYLIQYFFGGRLMEYPKFDKYSSSYDFYLYAFKQQIYNIASQLIGTGPLMVGWALQILDYLSGD